MGQRQNQGPKRIYSLQLRRLPPGHLSSNLDKTTPMVRDTKSSFNRDHTRTRACHTHLKKYRAVKGSAACSTSNRHQMSSLGPLETAKIQGRKSRNRVLGLWLPVRSWLKSVVPLDWGWGGGGLQVGFPSNAKSRSHVAPSCRLHVKAPFQQRKFNNRKHFQVWETRLSTPDGDKQFYSW